MRMRLMHKSLAQGMEESLQPRRLLAVDFHASPPPSKSPRSLTRSMSVPCKLREDYHPAPASRSQRPPATTALFFWEVCSCLKPDIHLLWIYSSLPCLRVSNSLEAGLFPPNGPSFASMKAFNLVAGLIIMCLRSADADG